MRQPQLSAAALELRLQPLQRRDALLHRRVRGEQVADRLLRAGREDVERGQLGVRAQVLLRDALHRPLIFSSAEASALGRPVMIAEPRSAANSR